MSAPEPLATSLSSAVVTGSRVAALRALRDRLAGDIDVCTSMRDVAALSQRFMDVLAQIDELGGSVAEVKPETKLDDFTKRLRERQQSAAKASHRA